MIHVPRLAAGTERGARVRWRRAVPPACSALRRQPGGRRPKRACRGDSGGAGACRGGEERAAEIRGLGRVRGLTGALPALAAELHLNGFTLGHWLVAAITHRLQREDNYSSLIFKIKAKPPARVLSPAEMRWRAGALPPSVSASLSWFRCLCPGTATPRVPSPGSLTGTGLAIFKSFVLPL